MVKVGWQPFGEGKNGHKNFRQVHFYILITIITLVFDPVPFISGEVPPSSHLRQMKPWQQWVLYKLKNVNNCNNVNMMTTTLNMITTTLDMMTTTYKCRILRYPQNMSTNCIHNLSLNSQEHRGHQSSGARAPELWCPHIFFQSFLDGVLTFILAVFR